MKLTPGDWRRQAEPIPTSTRVILGPLTTAFIPPPHCTRAALNLKGKQAVLGQTCHPRGTTATAADDTGCWPRATAYPTKISSNLGGMGFYSPGVMCPTGYHSACTAISTSKGMTAAEPQVTGKFQFPLLAGETAVGCCPHGYTCGAKGGAQTCHSIATETSFDAMTCTGSTGSNLDDFQVPQTMNSMPIVTMDLWAPMIQINHRATDLSKTKTSQTVTSTHKSTATPTASTSRTRTGASSSTRSTTTHTSTSTTRTKTDTAGLSSETDLVAKVKDVKTDESSGTAKTEDSTTKASTSWPADHTTSVAGSLAGEGIILDTRLPPPMPSSMLPTFTAAGAAEPTLGAPEPTQPNSFGTGAKVGVACAPLAGAALILLGVFYYKRRKQLKPGNQASDTRSISSERTAAEAHQASYFGGDQAPKGGHDKFDSIGFVPVPLPVHKSPHNEEDAKAVRMTANGPGPTVTDSGIYGDGNNKMTAADFYANPWSGVDEHETGLVPITAAARFKHAHTFSEESGSTESPIDGTSPFRLKRGNTLKGREMRLMDQENERHVSIEAQIVTAEPVERASPESVEWGEKDTLKRSDSFSRPRPRPNTTASSLYPDDRDSVVWNAADAPDLPDKPLPSIPEKGGLDRSKSFSRPRPRRDDSADTLVEGSRADPPPNMIPPVTGEGVPF